MKKILLSLMLLAVIGFTAKSQVYTSIANGNWSASSTWLLGIVPPTTIPNGATVIILNRVIYDQPADMEIRGTLVVGINPAGGGDTLRFPNDGSTGTGRSIVVKNTGFLSVSNGGIIIPVKTTVGANNSGNITNQGGHCVYFRSLAEVAQNWDSESNGGRRFTNSCLKLGENYGNKNSTDTLQGVCIEVGLQGSGNFENDGGTIRANTTSVLLKGTGGSFKNKSASSQILTYLSPTYAFQAINVPFGDLENVGTWEAPVNKYCVGGNITGSGAGVIDLPNPEDCPFFVTFSACADCSPQNSPLPVDFKSFTATRNRSNVLLKWETATEINNSGFAVERNTSGSWEQVAFVASQAVNGVSDAVLSYQFTDMNNTKGVSQYRIRQVDLDAKSKYSEIRSVRGDGQLGKTIVYPNPSNDGKVNVVFEDNNASRDISVSDMSGRTVRQMKGVTNNNITIENLTPGMYSLRILIPSTGEQSVEKIVVNKR